MREHFASNFTMLLDWLQSLGMKSPNSPNFTSFIQIFKIVRFTSIFLNESSRYLVYGKNNRFCVWSLKNIFLLAHIFLVAKCPDRVCNSMEPERLVRMVAFAIVKTTQRSRNTWFRWPVAQPDVRMHEPRRPTDYCWSGSVFWWIQPPLHQFSRTSKPDE